MSAHYALYCHIHFMIYNMS